LKNIFATGELAEDRVVKKYLTTAADGKQYRTKHYNLEAIIAVGYRGKSHRGTQFRRWATERLNEYLVKGFTMDDARLKQVANIGSDYFDEMLERIRDIRSGENAFIKKSAIFINWRSITIRKPKQRWSFLKSYKTNCISLYPAKLPPNWLLTASMPASRIWAWPPEKAKKSAKAMWP